MDYSVFLVYSNTSFFTLRQYSAGDTTAVGRPREEVIFLHLCARGLRCLSIEWLGYITEQNILETLFSHMIPIHSETDPGF